MKRQLFEILWILIGVALLSSCGTNTRDQVTSRFHSKQFTALHSLTIQQAFDNISVLPKSDYIVIDKTIINIKAHTFGEEPELRFYEEYYKSGSAQRFESLEGLLKQRNIHVSEQALNETVRRMKKLKIGDILKDKESNMVIYSWDMSAMWGANGIVFSPSGEIPKASRRNFDQVQRLSSQFFYWTKD